MSGGSLGQVGECATTGGVLVAQSWALTHAVDWLRSLGHTDAADEVAAIAAVVEALGPRVDALRPLLIVLDRYGSGDDGAGDVMQAVGMWRGIVARARGQCGNASPDTDAGACDRPPGHDGRHSSHDGRYEWSYV